MAVTNKLLALILFQGLLQGLLSQRWRFPPTIVGLIGSCVEIPCTFYPYKNSGTPAIVWYLYQNKMNNPIFNSHESSSVLSYYQSRTSLIPGNYSCALRIDPVTREDEMTYFPGTADGRLDPWSVRGRYLQLKVTDSPGEPQLYGPVGSRLAEGLPTTFTCSVEHTCGSTPPSLKWNKPGQTERQSIDLSGGRWREMLNLRYIPSYEDDGTQLKCTATYPNRITTERVERLFFKYAPKNVMVRLFGGRDLTEGSNIMLICSCKSNPPPQRYEWYAGKNKRNLQLHVDRIEVRNITKDAGPFTCAAINDVGKGESWPMEINVQYAATGVEVVILPPAEGAIELMCHFLSSRPSVTHYTWIKDGNNLLKEIGQILILDRSQNNCGAYSCIAHNTAGSSTSAELDFKDQMSVEEFHNEEGIKNIIYVTLFPVLGFICLSIATLGIYFYWRTKRRKTSRNENSLPLESTYTDLVKTEASNDYDIIKPSFTAQPATGQRYLTSDSHYENLQRKETPTRVTSKCKHIL